MNPMEVIVDFILHIDVHLAAIPLKYCMLTHPSLFLIVFAETGLVVAPFLPGDSLLFAAGAICSLGSMDITTMIMLLIVAAILGDGVNYAIGARIGPRVFKSTSSRWFNTAHVVKTQAFYEKHGGKTIIIARFMPFVPGLQRDRCRSLGRGLFSTRLLFWQPTSGEKQLYACDPCYHCDQRAANDH